MNFFKNLAIQIGLTSASSAPTPEAETVAPLTEGSIFDEHPDFTSDPPEEICFGSEFGDTLVDIRPPFGDTSTDLEDPAHNTWIDDLIASFEREDYDASSPLEDGTFPNLKLPPLAPPGMRMHDHRYDGDGDVPLEALLEETRALHAETVRESLR